MITICNQHQTLVQLNKRGNYNLKRCVEKSSMLNHRQITGEKVLHPCYDFWTIMKTNHSTDFSCKVSQVGVENIVHVHYRFLCFYVRFAAYKCRLSGRPKALYVYLQHLLWSCELSAKVDCTLQLPVHSFARSMTSYSWYLISVCSLGLVLLFWAWGVRQPNIHQRRWYDVRSEDCNFYWNQTFGKRIDHLFVFFWTSEIGILTARLNRSLPI